MGVIDVYCSPELQRETEVAAFQTHVGPCDVSPVRGGGCGFGPMDVSFLEGWLGDRKFDQRILGVLISE